MTNFFNVILNKNMNINNNTIINYSNHLKKGYLELIIGPMFAGKSTELIRIIKNYQVLNCKILTINHSINCRYGSDNIITHDLIEMKSNISLNDLSLLLKDDLLLAAEEHKVINCEEYKSKTSIQYQISERYGPGVHYLIPNTSRIGIGRQKGTKKIKPIKYCSLEEFNTNNLSINNISLKKLMKNLKPFLKYEKHDTREKDKQKTLL